MKVNILGGSNLARYRNFNSERTINWYPVPQQGTEQDKNPIALYTTPGLTLFGTLPGTYFRALYTIRTRDYPSRCFAVTDNVLYEIHANQTYNTIGTMSAMEISPSKVYIRANGSDELAIFSFNASYVYNLLTGTLNQITSNQFLGSVTYATYLDGYMAVVSGGSVGISTINSAVSWISTQDYSTTFKPSPVLALGVFMEQIYNFTSESLETYFNDGSTPYSRMPRSTISAGIIAKDSLATFKDGFMWLGKTSEGETTVLYMNGWTFQPPQSVTSPNITWALNQAPTLTDAYAYMSETKDGSWWYYLTIPSLKTTFVYDMQTKYWHERQSLQPYPDSNGDQVWGIFRGKHYTHFNGMKLYGDAYTCSIFMEDYTNQTENGNPIRRERTTTTYGEEKQQISVGTLELDVNAGYSPLSTPNPILTYQISRDGGNTFNQPKNLSLGTPGNYKYRVRTRKLGTHRDWTLRLVLTDPVDLMIQNAIIHGTVSQV